MKLKLTQRLIGVLITLLYVSLLNAQQLSSLQFNGIDNYVEIKDSPLNLIGNGDFTLEAWIKGDESEQTSHPMILSNRGSSSSGGGILFFFHNQWGGSMYKILSLQIGGDNYKFVNNGSYNGSLLDNECHHVAISRSGNSLSFYADGILFGNINMDPASASLNAPLLIGKDQPTNNTFNGLISQCRIWDVARTQAEIFDNKDITLQGNEEGLLAYWEMSEGNGQTLRDKAGNFDGTLGSDNNVGSEDPIWSNDGCVETTTTTSTTDLELQSLKIFPNPASDYLIIQSGDTKAIEVELIDQTGKVLLSSNLSLGSNRIDMDSIPKGIYFLRLATEDSNHTREVVIQ
ncbi:MAG: LamG-like jellyroll fold domain-containing protein [Bacteroidota bacterium]